MKETICITGLMLRNVGDRMIAEVEINGKWVEVINEFVGKMEVSISHIVEPAGIARAMGKLPDVVSR